jgi:3-oxoacyl-[acyl-carrier-protein] synthase-3
MAHARARIVSVGTAVPQRIVSNTDLEQCLDTSDEWITTRTGISRRHVFAKDEPASAAELGATAAQRALEMAGIDAGQIDGIICATFTPDNFFPSTACDIARKLGAEGVCAFDLSAACAGFVYSLAVANSLILSKQCSRIIVVGSEIISKTIDWTDRSTAILFGDGAGAVVVEAADGDSAGILTTYLASDGALSDILTLPAWGEARFMKMKGSEVFKYAVRMMAEAVEKALEACGLTRDDIDVLIPHQANIRIIQSIAEHMGLSMDKVVANLREYGNTSSASIPLALEEAWRDGRVHDGSLVAFTSLGGGVAYGSAIVRF